MTSQPGSQTVTLLHNISRSKGKQTMKFGQVMEYNKRNHAENETERLVPDLF